ncbi:MAG: nucleoside monophosphate kinase [bacterium]|nr:nucleoside monophosphate kinase [bacterium]
MQKPVIIVLGPSGSGKGTQVKLLEKKFGLNYVGSGKLLRERMAVKDFTGQKINEAVNKKGFLAPTSIIFKLWVDEFEKIKNKGGFKGLVMDGCPRKILEARLVDEALEWYEWDKNVKVFWIDIPQKEAIRRLMKRKRPDDSLAGIKKRLNWFETEDRQTIRYYQKTRKVIKINGEQSPEKVFQDIMKNLTWPN